MSRAYLILLTYYNISVILYAVMRGMWLLNSFQYRYSHKYVEL